MKTTIALALAPMLLSLGGSSPAPTDPISPPDRELPSLQNRCDDGNDCTEDVWCDPADEVIAASWVCDGQKWGDAPACASGPITGGACRLGKTYGYCWEGSCRAFPIAATQ